MKNGKMPLGLALIISFFFISPILASAASDMAKIPDFSDCNGYKGTGDWRESCFAVFRPANIQECQMIPKEISNYQDALASCYGKIARNSRDSQNACSELPLSAEYKDKCFAGANQCSRITGEQLKAACGQRVEKANSIGL